MLAAAIRQMSDGFVHLLAEPRKMTVAAESCDGQVCGNAQGAAGTSPRAQFSMHIPGRGPGAQAQVRALVNLSLTTRSQDRRQIRDGTGDRAGSRRKKPTV
jgi:hypothetical protein